MILFSSIIGLTYVFMIGSFYKGFIKKNTFQVEQPTALKSYSILIALRNEANNLALLFKSILELDYPKHQFEIILINDHSDDNSEELLQLFQKENPQLQIQITTNNKSGKKAAISTGISLSKYDWILTTDADCIIPSKWIQAYDSLLQNKKYNYISGPVALKKDSSFINEFQNIEFLSLQACTIGSFGISKPFMSNGANSCYRKQSFIQHNGFEGNESIASGDDLFLLEKIAAVHPTETSFVASQDAIVYTNSEKTWKDLINQKIRWAAKATAYKNTTGIFVGVIVFLTNLLLLVLPFYNWKFAIIIYVLKTIVDFLIIDKSAKFFRTKVNPISYIASSLLYPIFSIWVFVLAQFKGYEWKGRNLKR